MKMSPRMYNQTQIKKKEPNGQGKSTRKQWRSEKEGEGRKRAVAPGGTFWRAALLGWGGTEGFMFESQRSFLFTSYNYDNNFLILAFS